ncbi:MAG: hypothetical protein LBD09_02655 [Treponema sp.]|jgi:hypothetical protein|nr:hypothetical protein [Treponema sp.]
MRKTIITLALLLAVSAAALYFGWAQAEVPPGSWGVLRSKTHGTGGEVIRDGRFRWVWYKLIPRNVSVAVFTLRDMTIPLELKGTLPSAETYAALAGLTTDFSYRFSLSLTWRFRGESLPALTERENLLTQADLDRALGRLSGEIETHARTLLWAYGENEAVLKEGRETGTIAAMKTELEKAFPAVEILSCRAEALTIPDFILYEEVRNLYREYLAAQRGEVRGEIALMSARRVRNRRRFEELAEYGELLTKYPVLLDYLALEPVLGERAGD